MAVKSGGSASTDSNRALAEVVKQAKANNVPVDVSARNSFLRSATRDVNDIAWNDFNQDVTSFFTKVVELFFCN